MKLKDFQELRISVFLCPRATYITNFTRMPQKAQKHFSLWVKVPAF